MISLKTTRLLTLFMQFTLMSHFPMLACAAPIGPGVSFADLMPVPDLEEPEAPMSL
jgi:hypothetical protein